MKLPLTILRRTLGVAMLCIFALAITPSVVFHNMLAHHTDETIQHHHKKSREVANAGINCHWDNLVCEGSFLNDFSPVNISGPLNFGATYAPSFHAFYSQHHFYAELRGPPAVV